MLPEPTSRMSFRMRCGGTGLSKIGRASCRGRVEISGGGVSLKKKKKREERKIRGTVKCSTHDGWVAGDCREAGSEEGWGGVCSEQLSGGNWVRPVVS